MDVTTDRAPKSLRIVFLGTQFAATCLEQLLESRHEIVGVVTAPDRPAGRGRSLRASEVKQVAEKHGLPLAQPASLKSPDFHTCSTLGIPTWAWWWRFGCCRSVWNRSPLGTVNLHGSLLPQYRGAAPIHWAVLNGKRPRARHLLAHTKSTPVMCSAS